MKPKMVHIGHDEWWGAPMDVCPLCKGKDYSKLFAQDVKGISKNLFFVTSSLILLLEEKVKRSF